MKAKNRKEIFLKALANGEKPNIKPLTREEILLKKQAERESAGGGGETLVVNIIENPITDSGWELVSDVTVSEIYQAVQEGKTVIANHDGKYCTLMYATMNSEAIFNYPVYSMAMDTWSMSLLKINNSSDEVPEGHNPVSIKTLE